MNKMKKPRTKITERYDGKNRRYYYERRKYIVKLSRTEIGILKAALQYYLMDDRFGYAIWRIGGGSVGSSYYRHLRIICGTPNADGLLDELNHLSRVKESYSLGNIDFVHKLLQKEANKYQREAKKLERRYGMPQLQLAGRSEEELKQIEAEYSKWKQQQKKNNKKK